MPSMGDLPQLDAEEKDKAERTMRAGREVFDRFMLRWDYYEFGPPGDEEIELLLYEIHFAMWQAGL